jgi:hypothetical protein
VAEISVVDGIVVAEDGGEAFLLDTGSRRYYRLNEAGLAVWQAIAAGADPLGALRARHPAVASDVLARDVEVICDHLLSTGLVARSDR